MLIQLR